MKKKSRLQVFTKGIIRENPVFVLALGTCSTLAVTTSVSNALGMGAVVLVVLTFSNAIISSLKHIIPNEVRIPAFIVVISGLMTIVELVTKAYAPALNESLGIFLPLVVVNCIILGRAEAFASKNTVWDSILDGAGMGVGFTLALFLMGVIRELIGQGSLFGFAILPKGIETMNIFILAPGGFFVFGCLIAAVNKITAMQGKQRQNQMGCAACPNGQLCSNAQEKGE
ncbi:electron transport complex subunit E [Oscillospiraceae bacterium MB08-C2-2]|nr:electron transport complex subunit E [Oscillospiraceae bacterium MB08-C2-2]